MLKRFLSLLLVLLSLVFPFAGHAQREYSPNLALGGRAGATLSRMSFSPEVHQNFSPGLTMGLCVRYTEENFFGLSAEVNLTQRGWAENFERDNAPEYSYTRTLTYLSIPLLTHIYFGSQSVKGFFNLGPEVNFMLTDDINANFDYANYADIPGFPKGNRTDEQLNMNIDRRFDYGIAGGVGVEFNIKKRHSFMLEGRYYFGLGNIFKDSKRDFFSASRNQSIEVTLKYMFRIK